MCPVLHTRFIGKKVLICITNIFITNARPILDKTTTAKLTSIITEKIEHVISNVISKNESMCFKVWHKVISILQLPLSVFYLKIVYQSRIKKDVGTSLISLFCSQKQRRVHIINISLVRCIEEFLCYAIFRFSEENGILKRPWSMLIRYTIYIHLGE